MLYLEGTGLDAKTHKPSLPVLQGIMGNELTCWSLCGKRTYLLNLESWTKLAAVWFFSTGVKQMFDSSPGSAKGITRALLTAEP